MHKVCVALYPFFLEQFSPRAIRWDIEDWYPQGCRGVGLQVWGVRVGAGVCMCVCVWYRGAYVGCQTARGIRRMTIGASGEIRAWM